MTTIKVTDKKSLAGRNKIPHIARKLSMPWDRPEALDNVDWTNYDKKERSYKIRVNGKTVYEPENSEPKPESKAPGYFRNWYKDDVQKGKWI